MASRDFGFLSLRPPLVAYQANGLPVSPNNILITSNNGAVEFSSSITINTINVSSINTNIISSNIINANNIDVNIICSLSQFASTIDVNSINTSTINVSSINTNTIDTGTINVSDTINANTIISNTSITNFLSTFSTINLMNGILSPLILTWNTSSLFIDGHEVSTDGTISTVSTVFWDNLGGDGTIFNKNIGNLPTNYLVGIGTNPNPLNATLDVNYTGLSTVISNAFNVSSFNNRFTITNSSDGINNFMNAELINNQDDTFGASFRFVKTQNFNSTISGNELGYIDFYGTNPSLSSVRGAYILARQSGSVSTFTSTDLQFLTCTSSDENVNMVITKDGYIGIGTTVPTHELEVNGEIYISSDQGDNSASLYLSNGKTLITTSSSTYTGCFVELDPSGPNFVIGGAGTGNDFAIFSSTFHQLNNNTTVIGNINASGYISSNTLNMNNGNIVANTGSININGINNIQNYATFGPTSNILTLNTTTNSTLTTEFGIINQNQGIRLIDGFGNNVTRPPLNPTNILSSFVIHGASGTSSTSDDGFLQLSAGGGTNSDSISYIQLSGFSSIPDMNGNIVLGTEGTERIRILNNGNVNIVGETYISSGLILNGSVPGGFGALKIQEGNLENDIFIQDGTVTNSLANSGYFIGITQNFAGNASTFQIGRIDSGIAQINKAIYLTQSGNIGINTSNPLNTLDINGNIRIGNQSGNTSSFGIDLGTNGIGGFRSAYIFSDGENMQINNQQNGKLSFATNNLDKITILSTGNVGIGTTTPLATLDVNGNLKLETGNSTNPALFFSSDNDTGLYGISDGQMGISANGQERIRITSGDITLTPNVGNAVNITSNNPNDFTKLNVINTSNISSSVEISMLNGGGSYSLYSTDNEGSPAGSGLIPSTFQIYSYYPNPNPVLTIYPNGNTEIYGNINITGTAISRVATAEITTGTPNWSDFFGKYSFVNGDSVGTLTLPTGVSAPLNGTIIVIRNIGISTSLIISGAIGSPITILPGKTSSFVYTTTVTTGWYAL